MKNYFITKIRYHKLVKGKQKAVTEQYLMDAVSFTDAEAKIYKRAEEQMPDGFHIQAINRVQVDECFFYNDADDWYKVKMTYEGDSDSGKTKVFTSWVYLTAHNSEQALQRAEESMTGRIVDYELPAVTKTKIVEHWTLEPFGVEGSKIPPLKVPEGLQVTV